MVVDIAGFHLTNPFPCHAPHPGTWAQPQYDWSGDSLLLELTLGAPNIVLTIEAAGQSVWG